MADACVKVGVRVRPLAPSEKHQNSVLGNFDRESIVFKNQTFTLDYVFGPDLDQLQMYQSTAAPMLKSFMEGYNVTIMAYGQTGSGKTHTMGTSDCGHDDEARGLLPRFVSDLFENLKDLAAHEHVESKIRVSFLEIYGEDVHDLTAASAGRLATLERPSLPVRENDQGQVFVQGLQEQDVDTADAALEVLYQGARNRTTASTAMNAGSSRSHAVFTITLDQRVVSADDEDGGREMSSKLTFVDLAGSERLKRTGAEGQRMKEGIQINSGLFNLGQVINGLADDQRLKKQAKVGHIPYRNSKLTHLLKDALGGNSKTLFLACVSPAEINESETYSTLMYARQARNIQNKPIQNMDKTQAQIRRLKCTAKTWMVKALSLMYGSGVGGSNAGCRPPLPPGAGLSPLPAHLSAGLGHMSPCGRASTGGQYISLGSNSKAEGEGSSANAAVAQLLQRPEVQEYIRGVEEAISASLSQSTVVQSPRKVRLSIFASPGGRSAGRPARGPAASALATLGEPKKLFAEAAAAESGGAAAAAAAAAAARHARRASLTAAVPPSIPDEAESERLVSRMLEMMSKEREGKDRDRERERSDSGDGAVPKLEGDTTTVTVDREIQEKEEILTKLVDTVKGYAALKADYESLMDEINSLDTERRDLEAALQKAQSAKPADRGKGSAVNVERLQERFKGVTEELGRMRSDGARKEAAYKQMQRESRRCEQLSGELGALKAVKVALQKKQKEQAQVHLKFKKEQQCKIHQLKKSEVKKQQALNDLKNELTKKQRVLGHRDREVSRMQSKLKACEEHITQLLRIQTASRSNGGSKATTKTPSKPGSGGSGSDGGDGSARSNAFLQSLSTLEADHLVTSKSVLDNLVADRVERRELEAGRELKATILRELSDEVLLERAELAGLQAQLAELEEDHAGLLREGSVALAQELAMDMAGVEQAARAVQADLDGITREISMHAEDLREITDKLEKKFPHSASAAGSKAESTGSSGGASSGASWEDLGRNVISGLSCAQSQAAVWELLGEKAEALARATDLQERLKQTGDAAAGQQDAAAQFEARLAGLQEELREAERRRVGDVWALLKAQQQAPDADAAAAGGGGGGVVRGMVDQVALTRAQELENALEVCLANEDEAKAELEECQRRLASAEAEAEDLRLQHQLGSGETANGGGGGGGGYYEGLSSAWDALGTHSTQRADCVSRIEHARLAALQAAQNQCQEELLAAREEELRLVGEIEQLGGILGQPQGEEVGLHGQRDGDSPSLLARIHLLHQARAGLMETLRGRARQVRDLQGRLLPLLRHMQLGADAARVVDGGLGEVLDIPQFPFPEEEEDEGDDSEVSEDLLEIYINELSALGVVFTDAVLGGWVEAVRGLGAERADNAARALAAQAECSACARLLGFAAPADLQAAQPQRGLGLDLPPAMLAAACEALFDDGFSPRGSAALADALERIHLVLKTMDVSRRGAMKLLTALAARWNSVISFNGEDLSIPVGVEGVSPSKEILAGLFQACVSSWQRSGRDVDHFRGLLDALTAGLALDQEEQRAREALLQDMLADRCATPARRSPAAAAPLEEAADTLAEAFAAMGGVVAEFEETLMFMEEPWVRRSIEGVIEAWAQNSGNVLRMLALQAELGRMQALDGAVREAQRLDGLLVRHIREMEDFESSSKLNRAKLLSGSSKALVEEEKFRKTGKRKYEHVVEKLTAAFMQVQYHMLTPKPDLLTSSVLKLSSTAVAAVRGKSTKSTERTELMHLHTTTHGTKRWSGDLLEPEAAAGGAGAGAGIPPGSPHPVSTAAGSKAPAKHVSSSIGSPALKREHSGNSGKGATGTNAGTSIIKGGAVKHSQGVNVFADCLASSSSAPAAALPGEEDENTHVDQNSS
jgi:hypothetical protein